MRVGRRERCAAFISVCLGERVSTLSDTPGFFLRSDATIAYKRAVLNAIKYLANFGFTEQQVYLMLSCIPCQGRISGIVDLPNACATLAIPLAIFSIDVRPPRDMSKLEQLAAGISILNQDVCVSTAGGAVAYDSRLGS